MNRGRDGMGLLAQAGFSVASMRPRFMNRGSSPRNRTGEPKLGFNEAPIHESGKRRRSVRGLRRPLASMRPRFMNRGRVSG